MEKAYFQNIRWNILEQINKAEKEIKIAVCWFTNQQLFDAICEKLDSQVHVELIILNDYINNREDGLDFQRFIDLGGYLYFGNNESPMHNKYCIIDGRMLINGSYNWTYYAENKNEENVIIHFEKQELTNAFESNFERIKSELTKITKVVKNRVIEMSENNFLGSQNYLSQDYLYKAKETQNTSIVEKAFKLNPQNIKIQKQAAEFNLVSKKKTKYSIGEDVKDNKFAILIPKGSEIPYSGEQSFTTTKDKQEKTAVTIRYGENINCLRNTEIGSFSIYNIPPMKAGKVKLLTKFAIDVYGILHITEVILDNGHSKSQSYEIKQLLVEI